jgi:hypothetical protein
VETNSGRVREIESGLSGAGLGRGLAGSSHLTGFSREILSPAGQETGQGAGHTLEQDSVFYAEGVFPVTLDSQDAKLPQS